MYLVLGAIGSGKSIISDFLLSCEDFKNIEYVGSDIYKMLYFNQDIKLDSRGYRSADELVFNRIEQQCRKEVDFMYEFCPTNFNKVETIKLLIRKYNYKIISFFVSTESFQINIERCRKREKQGFDKVNEEKIKRRYSDAFKRIIEIIDLSDKMYFIDNSKDAPRVVAYFSNHKLEVHDLSCNWFKNKIEQKII
jgi:predicted ABC-type ATPase